MRCLPVAAAIVAATLLSAGQPRIAAAQGLLDFLFGGGASDSPRPISTPIYGYRTPLFQPGQPRDASRGPGLDSDRGGARYRTLCVRLCDGYYWPLSHAVPRSQLSRDASHCRASCGGEARLYFHDAASPDVADMVDLEGRAYARLATAYLYRKRRVEGCACKPEPWSETERARHARYAAQAAHVSSDVREGEASQRLDGRDAGAALAASAPGVAAPPEQKAAAVVATADTLSPSDDAPAGTRKAPLHRAQGESDRIEVRRADHRSGSSAAAANGRLRAGSQPKSALSGNAPWSLPSLGFGFASPKARWPGD